MKISKFLLKTTYYTLDTIFKTSKANIRAHGTKNIPDKSIIYVANHFTRMETLFLPYIIMKYTKKYVLILASSAFFFGTFAKLLEKLGAISSDDKNRDKYFIKTLLLNKYSAVIFPEGQMLKDKKIIEKGKYAIYNSGMRRAPHTGAAKLALLSEFYRNKLAYLKKINDIQSINKILDHYEIKHGDLEKILNNETVVIPVNISYYPIRAIYNAFSKIANFFAKDMTSRANEELAIEGSMLLKGVDIDIHFGKPILVKNYIDRSKRIKRNINCNKDCLDFSSEKFLFVNSSIELMKNYMESIYSMTTVNQDHIFSYILRKYPYKKISERDFKNRANLAITETKKLNLNHLDITQYRSACLYADDFYNKYNDFIKAAETEKLITKNNGIININKKNINAKYHFHEIRENNIVQVLSNEIQPLNKLIKILNKISITPTFIIRKLTQKKYHKIDKVIFKNDYKENFIQNESKPMKVGMPFFYKKSFQQKGVILIHGYMSAPEEIKQLAKVLHKNNFATYGVRLSGHGTSPEDLAKRYWCDWYDSVNRAYIVMKNSVKDFAILGFSTGGGLALLQAANKNNRFKGVIAINTPLQLNNIKSYLASTVVAWNNISKILTNKSSDFNFVKNDPENPDINYLRNPANGINELEQLMKLTKKNLPNVITPTLIIQGSADPIVNPSSANYIYNNIGSKVKELYEVETSKHVIVRGKELVDVSEKTLDFLKKVFNP